MSYGSLPDSTAWIEPAPFGRRVTHAVNENAGPVVPAFPSPRGCVESPAMMCSMRSSAPLLAILIAGVEPVRGAPWFSDQTARLGLDATLRPYSYTAMKMPDIMASGVAVHDFDNDGDLDLYFTNCAWDLGKPHTAKTPRNRYYRNDAGKYIDATQTSGLAHGNYGVGVAVGDLDNDGDLDLFAANYDKDLLFRNKGKGVFEDISANLGMKSDGWSCSAAFLDYDRDGFLDLSINQYAFYDSTRECRDPAGRRDFCGPKEFPPLSDVLLRNHGNGKFADVSAAMGMHTAKGAALGVISEDFNLDGWPDLYVANDGYANNIWISQAGKKYVDDALILGCALNGQGMAEAGMGVVAFDAENDLDLDIFLTHLRNETNTIFLNLGVDRGFDDATAQSGLGGPSMAYTGFGTAAFDMELDGDLDLFAANGAVLRGNVFPGCKLGEPWKSYAEPNQLFVNDGKGKFKLLGSAESGAVASDIEISRGTAGGDIDGDGDFDLVVANVASPHRVYRNDTPRQGHWVTVRAYDPRLKRDVLGSTVIAECGGKKYLRSISSSWSYLSSSEARAHFGIGSATKVDAFVVRWQDGAKERFPGGPADRAVTLERGKGKLEK